MSDDLPFDYPDTAAANPAAPGPRKRPHRHRWSDATIPPSCAVTGCGVMRDPARSRMGKLNRQRGNAIEREVGKLLGLRRVGQYGGPDDLSGEMFAAQVKSGGAFSERFWSWLKAIPRKGDQTPLLVVTDAPGPGHRRRAVVILDLTDWRALHGPTGALPADPLDGTDVA